MNALLWVLQALLAAAFAWSGAEKALQPRAALSARYPWMQDTPAPTVRIAAVAELAAAVGLIVPAAVGIAAILTPAAAAGLVVLMALAAALHLRRHEAVGVAITSFLLLLAAFVAWARFGPYGW